MISRWPVFIALLVLSAIRLSAEESGSTVPGVGSLAVGYDEGLVARYCVIPNVSAYAGASFYVRGADTIGEQPLNCGAWKLGGEYDFRVWDNFRVAAFGEWREEMVQKQILFTPATNQYMRYNQWNTIFRVGIRPELFVNKHFSVDYKLGLQYVFHSADFMINDAHSGLESMKNDYSEFGVYEARFPPITTSDNGKVLGGFLNQQFLLAIGFNIYIF